MQRLTRTLAMASALAFAGVLAGCGDDVTVANPTTVTVTPASADLSVGGTVTLTAAVTTTNANKGVTWTSSDNAKATVDANGKVTAVAAGNATITATAAADAGAKASALINISASKGVRSVTVNPSNGIIKVGEFIQLAAQVDRDPGIAGTVTWTSSANTIATVDGTGKVTGVANGSAIITAASTVDASVTGTMALTVRPLQPAQVSVQKVTTGSTQTPVNPNNVAGQIDVTLNVDPGDQTVTKVEVLLQQGTGPEIVACSQNLSVAESEALRMAGAFENVEAVDIVCSINTAQFDATNGTVTYGNGTYSLRARATVAGGTGNVASPSVPLIFNNQSGFIAMVDNTNNVGGPKSAINPTNGLRYIQGDVTLKLAAVNYASGGATVTAVTGNFLGQAFSSSSPTGQVFTFTFTEEDDLDDYQTPLGSGQSIPVITSSSLSSGTQGATTIINVGASADNAGLARFDSVRVDNVEPAVPTLNDFPNWVRGAFTFDTTNAGVEDVEDLGVDNVTVKFFVIKGDLPDDDDCDVTGMTEVATAASLDETLTSIEYNGKVIITDALGNKRCVEFNNTFGVDKGAPEIDDLSAPAQGDIFATIAVGPDDSISATISDTLSGPFEPTPLLVSIRRRSSSSSNVCVVGATSACNQVASANPLSSRGGSTSNGYYTYTVAARDSAGNTTANTVATFLYDSIAPAQTGAQQQPASYTAGAAATFTVAASDNIDLGAATGILTYAGMDTIQFAGNTLGTFGSDAFTTTGTASFTVPSFIRCLAANNDTTAAGGVKATEYNILINDLAGNSFNVGNTAIPAIAVTNCGTVGNSKLDGTGLTLATSETDLSLDGDPDEKTTTLTARVETVASESAQPFTRVDFYVRNAAGRLQLIGTDASASVGPQGAIRPFSYTFNWTPTAAGTFDVLAIGVDAQGDAMLVGPVSITVGP